MLKKTNNQTNEKKSFKEVLVENRYKILTGASIVISAGFIYFIGKELKVRKDLINAEDAVDVLLNDEKLRRDRIVAAGISLNSKLSCDNADRLDQIEQILNEGGVLNQAIATITGKRDRLNSKLLRYINKPGSPENDKIIEQCKGGIEEFNKMLEGCDFIKFCCKYKDGVQELLDEE